MMTPQQSASILARMFGYRGPADQRSVDQFLASNPAAASRMGKYQETMKQMVGDKDIMEKHIGFTHGLIGQKKKDGLITDKQLTTG